MTTRCTAPSTCTPNTSITSNPTSLSHPYMCADGLSVYLIPDDRCGSTILCNKKRYALPPLNPTPLVHATATARNGYRAYSSLTV